MYLKKIRENASIYLCTSSNKKSPYVTYLALSSTELIHKFSKLTRGRITKQKENVFFMQLINYLKSSEIEIYGKGDVLKNHLMKRSWYLWKDKYCTICESKDCLKDSVSCFKCHRSAFVIGALDEIETVDIYMMYKKDGESVYSCFRKIEKHIELDKVVEKALPRWPDAFFNENKSD